MERTEGGAGTGSEGDEGGRQLDDVLRVLDLDWGAEGSRGWREVGAEMGGGSTGEVVSFKEENNVVEGRSLEVWWNHECWREAGGRVFMSPMQKEPASRLRW